MTKKFKRILLVDDDEIANFLHKDLLEEMDIADQILTARDGFQALQMIQDTDASSSSIHPSFDLIFLDLKMPAMDGFEFLAKLQESPYQPIIPIVILTSSIHAKDTEQTRQYKPAGYINKPLTVEKLTKLLKSNFTA